MPEVMAATPLIYIAHDRQHFEAQIAKALAEDSPELRRQRQDWAKEHTWDSRTTDFMRAVDALSPRVSIVVLAYNNWKYTAGCLRSVLQLSEYPNLEVIVVDNASTDDTPRQMKRLCTVDPRIKYIRNDENVGFAAGNNVGLKAATGDYIVLLNNDTYVTRGWVRDLIRPLMHSQNIGLVGPLTNNIGNEQKIRIEYSDMQEMERKTRRFTRLHFRQRYKVKNLAFFCVAMRRDVVEKVGLLDEAYGLGFFEDDDYCQRVLAAGYELVVVDDVFVHHHLSASFNALGQEQKKAQMQRNKAIYEKRWGQWTPHQYRQAPGFG
jgi:GT2 family glycosyltransferase